MHRTKITLVMSCCLDNPNVPMYNPNVHVVYLENRRDV